MKRLLLVFVLLLVVAMLALPAGAGLLLQQRGEAAFMERWPDATLNWNRGWLRSQAELNGDGWRGRFELRHPAFGPASVLQIDGRVTLDDPAVPLDLDARLDPALRLHATLTSPALDLQTQATWRIEDPQLEIEADRFGRRVLEVHSPRLQVHDGLGNRLTLDNARIRLDIVPVDEQHSRIELDLQATRLGAEASRLTLLAGPVEQEAAQQLIEAGRALADAEPDSTAAGLAAIGALAAWQQLVAGGLQLEIKPSSLDRRFALEGQWQPAERRLQLTGGGPETVLLDWLVPLYGLQLGLAPPQAQARASESVAALVQQPGIERNRDAVQIAIDRD